MLILVKLEGCIYYKATMLKSWHRSLPETKQPLVEACYSKWGNIGVFGSVSFVSTKEKLFPAHGSHAFPSHCLQSFDYCWIHWARLLWGNGLLDLTFQNTSCHFFDDGVLSDIKKQNIKATELDPFPIEDVLPWRPFVRIGRESWQHYVLQVFEEWGKARRWVVRTGCQAGSWRTQGG